MNTSDFLKQHSKIDHSFIDLFYNKEPIDFTGFTIKLTDITVWLNVKQAYLKRVLYEEFILNEDFKNDNNIEMLTFSCAKLLCLSADSTKLMLVARSYLEIEKLLIKHTDNIINELQNKIASKAITKQ
jgi:hypothetical protein